MTAEDRFRNEIMVRHKDALNGYWRVNVAVAANALLVVLILLRNTRQLHFDAVSWTYMLSVSLGYYILAIYLIASLSYLILSPFNRVAVAVSGLTITAAVYYLLIDSFTFTVIRMHIDIFWLRWIIDDFAAFGLSPSTLRSAAFALVALVAVEACIFALAKRVPCRRYVIVAAWIVLPSLFVVSQAIHALAYEMNDIRVTGLTPPLPFYAPITSHRQAEWYSGLLSIDDHASAGKAGDGYEMFHYPLHPIVCDRRADTSLPNIVVLFLESWRYDMMNDSVTPHVFALAQKATVCRNHLCSGNSTVAGIFGFFYGLYPTYWSAVKAGNAVIHNSVLMDVLVDDNYTFGIYAKSNFERHKIKDAIFRDIPVHEDFAGSTKIAQDADMNKHLRSFLRERKSAGGRFMAFAFYKANHAPYEYPAADTVFRPAADQNLMGAGNDTDPKEYLNDYRNATRYVDGLVGEVLRELDSLGLAANTIVIVTTDHGEEFNDDRAGFWGHGSNYTQYQIRVPLVFYAPGKSPRQIECTTSHIDIVPTLLEEFFGCRNPAREYSNGRNLFAASSEARPFVVGSYVNHAFIIEDNVYEINPYNVMDYRLNDIRAKASAPSRDMLLKAADEIGRFLGHN
jgi:uncharacterized protein